MHSYFHRSVLLLGAFILTATSLNAQAGMRRKPKSKAAPVAATSSKPSNGKETYSTDVALTFVEEHLEYANDGHTAWLKGGSADIGITFFHGFGVGFNLTGQHGPNIVLGNDYPGNARSCPPAGTVPFVCTPIPGPYTGQSFDLGKISFGVGPRYTVDVSRYTKRLSHDHSVRVFGQFLFGESHSFNTYIPYTIQYGNQGTGAGATPQYIYETTNTCVSEEGGGGIDIGMGRFSIRPIQGAWVRTHVPDGNTNRQESVRLSAGIAFHFSPKN